MPGELLPHFTDKTNKAQWNDTTYLRSLSSVNQDSDSGLLPPSSQLFPRGLVSQSVILKSLFPIKGKECSGVGNRMHLDRDSKKGISRGSAPRLVVIRRAYSKKYAGHCAWC